MQYLNIYLLLEKGLHKMGNFHVLNISPFKTFNESLRLVMVVIHRVRCSIIEFFTSKLNDEIILCRLFSFWY